MTVLGRTTWVIAEGYIPPDSTGPAPQMLSHETACILNPGDRDATVRITVYFADVIRLARTWWSSRPGAPCTSATTT